MNPKEAVELDGVSVSEQLKNKKHYENLTFLDISIYFLTAGYKTSLVKF